MSRHHHRQTRLATTSPAMTRQVGMLPATPTTPRTSRKSTLPSRHRRCRSMNSPIARAITTSGRRGIGSGRRPVITGYPERGCWRRMSERCGHRDIGASPADATAGITATGDRTSVSMAASIMATVITETAIEAAIGIVARSITTAQLPGSITTFVTSIRATSAITTAPASAITAATAD